MGKDDPILSRLWSLRNVVSSSSRVRNRAATKNEFGYSTAVSIMLVAIAIDDSEVYVLH